jgi:hypothetical protein
VFDLGPAGTSFDPPGTLTIRYDPQRLPPGTFPRLHKLVDGVWQRVPGSSADLAAHIVSAPLTGFSTWAVLGTGVVLTVHVFGGQGRVSVVNTTLDPCTYNDVTCATDFPPGTNLTLRAEALGPDALFEEWSGTGSGFACTTDAECSVTMDKDREVTATFSMPGLVSLSSTAESFSMTQGGTGSPTTTQITVSNIGGRDLHLGEPRVVYSQHVPPWLAADMTSLTVTNTAPQTLTLSVIANPLPPGEYQAHVLVGDGFPMNTGVVNVALTVSATTSYTYDGTGKRSGPLPLITAIFTNATGTDIYPVGSGEYYFFVLFDTGSDIVNVSVADATALNIGSASTTNLNQNTRIRLNGLGAIDPATLNAPIGPHGTTGGAQAEVLGIRVGPASPPQRADRGATLVGAPVANARSVRVL